SNDGWRVENGVLTWSSQDPRGFYLWTERDDFRDFHLSVETRISNRQYAQILVRNSFGQSGIAHDGYLVVLNSTNGNPSKTGSLVIAEHTVVEVSKSSVPPDQWFKLEVIAEGNRVIIKVNGHTTADYRDPDRRFACGRITLFAGNRVRESGRRLEFRKIEIKV